MFEMQWDLYVKRNVEFKIIKFIYLRRRILGELC